MLFSYWVTAKQYKVKFRIINNNCVAAALYQRGLPLFATGFSIRKYAAHEIWPHFKEKLWT